MAESIERFFQNERIIEDIQRLQGLGLAFADEERLPAAEGAASALPLKGQRIALTGKLPLPRSQVKALIERHGAVFAPSVGKGTDILLAGEKPGGKKREGFKGGCPHNDLARAAKSPEAMSFLAALALSQQEPSFLSRRALLGGKGLEARL